MKHKEVKISFLPNGKSVFALPGTSIMETAARAGIILQAPCGGGGTCGKCRIKIITGECDDVRETHRATGAISDADYQQGYRLACQTRIKDPITIEVPEDALFENSQKVLISDSGEKPVLKPVVKKTYFKLSPPVQGDSLSDTARFRLATGVNSIPLNQVAGLTSFLRKENWEGTAVTSDSGLLTLEKGDTSTELYGIAFDIGTTTIVGTLFNMFNGKELAVASDMNPQTVYGDDVISRIRYARETQNGLSALRTSVIGTVNSLINELTAGHSVKPNNVYEVTIAGNTTMQEIFCGVDPSPLGEIPFSHAFDEGMKSNALWCGLQVNPNAEIYVFPQLGGFLGGDTSAGMLAARIDKWKEPVLFVDIGTNGEIVLAHNGNILAASTAAGPAFEGARIINGMRAMAGAVEKVMITDGDLDINIIGNTKAAGICGTALIDAVAEMLRLGIIDETGRILPAEELPQGISDSITRRLIQQDGETHFLLAAPPLTISEKPIVIWQRDIRELQLATGAIRAGINILLKKAGLEPGQLGAVLLAGGFGNFIRRSNAKRIGLLPQVESSRIRFIGNAASLGAKMALLSEDEREYVERLRKKTVHVDLSSDMDFQSEFAMSMIFPEE